MFAECHDTNMTHRRIPLAHFKLVKSFITLVPGLYPLLLSCFLHPGVKIVKLFSSSLLHWPNKLERLSLECLSGLILYVQVKSEPTQVAHLLCALVWKGLLALHANHCFKTLYRC
jgi:hypothetical protein